MSKIIDRDAIIEQWLKKHTEAKGDMVNLPLECKVVVLPPGEYSPDRERDPHELIVVPSGVPVLDRAIGIGGIALGYQCEIFGDEGVGKSSLAMIMAASFQKYGHHVLWVDMEQRFWGSFALMLGVQPNKFTLVRPVSGENAIQIVKEALGLRAYGLIIVDSVAALVTGEEMEKDIGEYNQKAPLSRLMSESLRQIGPLTSTNAATLVWINQLRSKPMHSPMGKDEDTAGGRALKFWSSIRIELDKTESKQIGSEVVGHKIRAKIVKNSWAPPFKKCFYDFRYDSGLDYIGSVIDAAIELGIINKRSSFYDVPGVEKPFAGLKAADEFIRANPDVYNDLAERVRTSDNKLEYEKIPIEKEE